MMRHERSKTRLMNRLKRRKFRIGAYAALTAALTVAAVIGVNIAVKAAEDRWALRIDLSYNSLMKVSQQTDAVLRQLDQDVVFYLLAKPGSENRQALEMLRHYRAANPRIEVKIIDPDWNPGLLNDFYTAGASLGMNTVIVSNADRSRFKVYAERELIDYGYDEQNRRYYIRSYLYETMFTQGILYVTRAHAPLIRVLQGHGEILLSELKAMDALLSANNCRMSGLSLTDDLNASDDDMLLVMSPQKDLTDGERDRIMDYLRDGGGMIYVCDVTAPDPLPNFQSLLDFYGVGFEQGMVIANMSDSSQYYPSQPAFLLPAIHAHAITAPLLEKNRTSLCIPTTRSIRLPAMEREEFTVSELLSSKAGSYRIDLSDASRTLEKQTGDAEGPFTVAAAVQYKPFAYAAKISRIALFGSAPAIAEGNTLNAFYNGELLLSAVLWVAGEEEGIDADIVAKSAQRTALRIPSAALYYTLAALVALVIPLAVLAAGVIVWMKRRHL